MAEQKPTVPRCDPTHRLVDTDIDRGPVEWRRSGSCLNHVHLTDSVKPYAAWVIEEYTELYRSIMTDTWFNGPIQAKCVASVTNCGVGLETAMAHIDDQEMATFH